MLQVYDAPDIISVDKHDDSYPRPGALVRHRYSTKESRELGILVSRCWGPDDKPMQLTIVWTTLPDLLLGYEDWKSMHALSTSLKKSK